MSVVKGGKPETKALPPKRKPRVFRRMAFGNLETGVSLDEWELGSRSVADLCAENNPTIAYPILKTRMAKAFGKAAIRKGDDPELLKPFENCWITLLASPEVTYYCDGISEYFGELRCYKIEELGGKDVRAIKWVRLSQIKRAWTWQGARHWTQGEKWVDEWDAAGWF